MYPNSTDTLNPPLNAVATVAGNNVGLSWQDPGAASGTWLHYDSGNNNSSVGTGNIADFDTAVRYPAAALTSYAGMYLYSVKVFPTAAGSFAIRVWTGGTATEPGTLVVDQPFTPVVDTWNTVNLSSPVPISGTQELWFGMHCMVQTGYPAGCDAGPANNGFGNMIYWNGAWTTLYNLSGTLNYNWNIQGYVGSYPPSLLTALHPLRNKPLSPITDAGNRICEGSLTRGAIREPLPLADIEPSRSLLGYRVWRLQAENQGNETTWTSISPNIVTATSLTDTGWNSLANGNYKWAVKAEYTGGLLSAAAFSNTLVKGSPTGTLQGIVRNSSNLPIMGATITCGTFTGTTNSAGVYSIVVPQGTYSVTASFAGYASSTQYGVVINSNQVTTQNFVLTTSSSTFQDSFESYADFALSFAPWTLVDVDMVQTYGFTGITFPNSGAPMAYIIFNPSATTPALDTSAHSGAKMAACFASNLPPNNDWLISPQITGATELKFWARSYVADYGLERFKVGVSTSGSAPASFTIISGANYIQAPTTWTEYTYNLTPYGNSPIYVGIQCVSNDAFILFVDDVSINGGFNPPQDPFGTPVTLPTSMSVVAGVVIGEVQASNGDVLAAYVNVNGTPQLRGKQSVQVLNGVAGCIIQVYTETSGESISFKLWDASANQIITSLTSLASIVNGTVGSTGNLFMIDFAAPVTQNITLTSGWNLMSLNVSPANHNISSLCAALSGIVQQIKGTDGIYIPNNPYSTLTALTDGKAYNFLLSSAVNWSVTGLPIPASTPLPLQDGWNMVAYLPQTAMPVTNATQSITEWVQQVKGTDGVYIPNNPYSTLTAMFPGKGYWIKLNGAHNLVYPSRRDAAIAEAASPVARNLPEVKVLPTSMTLLAKCDGAETGDILLARVGGELRGAELFVAPEGRSAALLQIYTETIGEVINFSILQPNGTELPIDTVLSSQPGTNLGVYPNLFNLELKAGAEDTVPIPTELGSCYPNPFNPSTTISFSVANDNCPVSIEVYNLKGQKVRTLLSSSLPKGKHSVVWNGKDDANEIVASGVYFIRMNTPAYHKTTKALLSK